MRLKPLMWVKDANLLIEENPPSVCSVYLTQTLREQGGGGATAVPPRGCEGRAGAELRQFPHCAFVLKDFK